MAPVSSLEATRVLIVHIGAARIAIPAGDVAEILRRPNMIRVPHGPANLAGLANVRGSATPILSLAGLLGLQGETGGWVILLGRSQPVGLIVDAVDRIGDGDSALAAGSVVLAEGTAEGRIVDLEALIATAASPGRGPPAVRPDGAAAPAAIQQDDTAIAALLSLELGAQHYAMPLADIVEIAVLPADIVLAEDATGAAIGTATLRGTAMALISLRALLGLAHCPLQGTERVVIVTFDDGPAALVVDRVHSILRVATTMIAPAPAHLNRESDAAWIDSVVRLPDGRGVVALLTAESLKRRSVDDGVGPAVNARVAVETVVDDSEMFIIFRLGGEDYGWPVAKVTEILKPRETIRVPGSPPFVAGAFNLRGRVVPLIDQRARFNAPRSATDNQPRVLVADTNGMQAGFLVDGVSGISRVTARNIGPVPPLEGRTQFDRVIMTGDQQMILVVDPDALLTGAEATQMAAGGGRQASARS